MATLIKIGDVLEYAPLSRSTGKLLIVSEYLNNPKLTPEYIQADFALYMAQILKERVRDSINTQKIQGISMKALYDPLNPDYAASKPKQYQDKFWINTRYLVDSISVYRTGKDIRIGFKPSAYYPGTRLKVVKVLLWMERGTKTMPPRPLILPHARILSKNVSHYFKSYLKLRFNLEI